MTHCDSPCNEFTEVTYPVVFLERRLSGIFFKRSFPVSSEIAYMQSVILTKSVPKVCSISKKKYAETSCLLLKIPRIQIF